MKLAWVIVYVPDVPAALSFYEHAFGQRIRLSVPTGDYGELDTGSTVLAFAADELGESNFPGGPHRPALTDKPANVELAFTTDDVDAAVASAVAAGCTLLTPAAVQSHGQTVAWVRDPWGTLIELCTPIG
ncbi:MAG: VOC family protein [Solirubrobacteraceae bacterium]|nr:VOC family protein [Solirubrobacteraceae bacterium]